jgi:hypothetical protein
MPTVAAPKIAALQSPLPASGPSTETEKKSPGGKRMAGPGRDAIEVVERSAPRQESEVEAAGPGNGSSVTQSNISGVKTALRTALDISADAAESSGKWLVLALLVVAIAFGLSVAELWLQESPRARFLTAIVPAAVIVFGAYAVFVKVLVPLWRESRLRLALLRDRSKEIFSHFAEYPLSLGRALVSALESDRAAKIGRVAALVPALLGSALVVWLGYLLATAVYRHVELGNLDQQALPLTILGTMTLACLVVTIWFWRMIAPERPVGGTASALAQVEGKDLAAMLAHGPLTDGTMYRDAKDTLLFVHGILTAHAKSAPGWHWNVALREKLFSFVVGAVELHCGNGGRSTAHTAVVLARVLGNLGHAPVDVAAFMASLPQLASRPALQRAYETGRQALATSKREPDSVSPATVRSFGQMLSAPE